MSKEEKMFALIEEFEDSSLNGRDFCKEKGPFALDLLLLEEKESTRGDIRERWICCHPF